MKITSQLFNEMELIDLIETTDEDVLNISYDIARTLAEEELSNNEDEDELDEEIGEIQANMFQLIAISIDSLLMTALRKYYKHIKALKSLPDAHEMAFYLQGVVIHDEYDRPYVVLDGSTTSSLADTCLLHGNGSMETTQEFLDYVNSID